MSAVLKETEVEQRHLTGAEYSAIRSELNSWGGWIERHMGFEGYPRISAVDAYLEGCGGGTGGHRILCLDMPDRVYAVHGRVLRLSECEREAVWLYYVFRMKADGSVWTLKEKCDIASVSVESVRKRLQRAYPKILGIR